MKLLSLQLCNFRPFFGELPKIKFAHGNKNITLIHASNGTGKTALLNAFTWTLFDSLTPGFLLPDQIVNKRAVRNAQEGEIVKAWVKIEFEHDGRKYIITRTASAQRISAEPGYHSLSSEEPTLQWSSGLDGHWHNEEYVADIIGKILPKDLHAYFFFDGERIERIVQPTDKEKKEIGKATKMLFGIEQYIRAVTHLDSVRCELERELARTGDLEIQELYKNKQQKEKKLKEKKDRQDEIDINIGAQKHRIREIEGRIRQCEEFEDIQKRRDRLNIDKKAREESLINERKNLASTISSSGYTFFINDPIEKFRELIDSLEKSGELPVGMKINFVNNLLDNETCICERELKHGSNSRKAVEDWKEKAGLSDVETKAIKMQGEITGISRLIPENFERLDQIQQKRESDRKELSRIEGELDDISEKLKGSPKEEIKALEGSRKKAEETIEDLLREQGENQGIIRNREKELADLQQEINKYEAKEDKQRIIQRRIEAACESINIIDEIRERIEADFRKGLQKKISKLFSTISPTPYIPVLKQDYSLSLLESAGGMALPVATSQSESQILSLSFIGSIMQLAREYYAKQERLPSPDTSTYPVVMDSPFGNLDSNYRHQVAEHMPALADQVIVLVSETQWRGEVEQSMTKRIGRSYVVTYYSPKEDLKEKSIGIGGTSWELIKASPNEFEYSEIREVIRA